MQNTNGKRRGLSSASDRGTSSLFFHDAGSKHARHDAQERGGKNNRKNFGPAHPPAREFDLSDPTEILRGLSFVVNELAQHPIDAKSAHKFGYLADVAIRARNLIDVKSLLASLERIQRAVRHRPADEQAEQENYPSYEVSE
jgi:hypothetical protein